MKRGRYYMHENAMDACIHIIHSYPITHTRFSLKVEWVNLGYAGQPWLMYGPERLEIKDSGHWRDVTSLIYNPRSESGLPK